MSLVTIAETRAIVTTSLTDSQLQAVIDREEARMVQVCGAHYVDDDTRITETLYGEGGGNLYLKRRLSSVYRVTEDGSVLSAANGDFRSHLDQGRLERLPSGTSWGAEISAIYVPYDDNDHRAQVLIEMVRLAIERTAMRSENVAGEYSYNAPDWERERARLLRQLIFRAI